MARRSRFFSLVLVTLFLASPLAAVSRTAHPAPRAEVSFARLWAGISRLVGLASTTPTHPPVLPAGDNGSTMDPDGKKPSVLPTGDNGSTMDPNGGK